MAEKETLYTSGKLAKALGISAGKLKKLMAALEVEPCQVKGRCKYYDDETLAKLRLELEKA